MQAGFRPPLLLLLFRSLAQWSLTLTKIKAHATATSIHSQASLKERVIENDKFWVSIP